MKSNYFSHRNILKGKKDSKALPGPKQALGFGKIKKKFQFPLALENMEYQWGKKQKKTNEHKLID